MEQGYRDTNDSRGPWKNSKVSRVIGDLWKHWKCPDSRPQCYKDWPEYCKEILGNLLLLGLQRKLPANTGVKTHKECNNNNNTR